MVENKKSIEITVDSIKEEACRVAGLHQWGDDDFHLPLEQLIRCFKDKYSPAKNPKGPLSGIRRIIRGGSWVDPEDNLWCTLRNTAVPYRKASYLDFRVVRTAKQKHKLQTTNRYLRVRRFKNGLETTYIEIIT